MGADLTQANLDYATLTNATLKFVDLTNAFVRHTDLTNADLSLAQNLDKALFDCDTLTTANLPVNVSVSHLNIVDSRLNEISSCD